MADLEFRRDLYRGAARDYDRFRVPYPPSLIDDLAARSGAKGQGRPLDLACGTGQVTFALARWFGEVWAVDQEPDMTSVVAEKARAAGLGHIRVLTSSAEDLPAPGGSFDLVAIGNAFHRLPRAAVAASALRWLRPGQFLALLYSGENPWLGEAPWQRVMAGVVDFWMARSGGHDRIPPGYEQDRRERPDRAVLAAAGFDVLGEHRFPADHSWTTETLTGLVFSTSVLSRVALGSHAAELVADLRRELHGFQAVGGLPETIGFANPITLCHLRQPKTVFFMIWEPRVQMLRSSLPADETGPSRAARGGVARPAMAAEAPPGGR
jgi:SAM-dependent methyltransferase